jgi:cell division protein FtsL
VSDPVVELVETLKAVRLEVAAIGQKIDTKAATPAQLAELTRAVKSADPDELASSIATAAVQAGQTIAAAVREESTKLSTTATSLATHDTNLNEAIESIAATGEAIRNASFWLNFRAIAVLVVAVVLVVAGSLVSLAWQRHESAILNTEETALRAQIQTDKANLAALKAKGGNIHLTRCGSKDRLCVEVAPDQLGPNMAHAITWYTAHKMLGPHYVIVGGH